MSIQKLVLGHSNRLLYMTGLMAAMLTLKLLEDHAEVLKRSREALANAANYTLNRRDLVSNDTHNTVPWMDNHLQNVSGQLQIVSNNSKVTLINCAGNTTDSQNCTIVLKHDDSPNCAGKYTKEIKYPKPGEKCEKRLPKAIVVGIQKCGTSALLYFLGRHPEISAVLEPTEINYFNRKIESESLSWYRNMMNCSFSNQISIEKSPMYFYDVLSAYRIKRMDPKMKIIIILKDPIVRALSLHAMQKDIYRREVKPFEKRVIDQETGQIKSKNILIQYSIYPSYLTYWLNQFDLSQIHFVDGHNLEAFPAVELNHVEEFLGIGNYFTCENFAFNATKGKYCFKTTTGMDCLHEGKGRKHEDVSDGLMKKLQDFFRPKNEEVFAMAKRRFDWGY